MDIQLTPSLVSIVASLFAMMGGFITFLWYLMTLLKKIDDKISKAEFTLYKEQMSKDLNSVKDNIKDGNHKVDTVIEVIKATMVTKDDLDKAFKEIVKIIKEDK